MKRHNLSKSIPQILLMVIIAIAWGCAPLRHTPEDFRGVTYQRYQESPQKSFSTVKAAIEKHQIGWAIDSTKAEDNTFKIYTDFAPVDLGTIDELNLTASIQEDKGTLVSLELHNSDSSAVITNAMYEDITQPIFDQLNNDYLTTTNVDAYLEDTEPEKVNNEDFFDRIGFFANLDGGYSARYNAYGTNGTIGNEAPVKVNYDTKRLTLADLHARTGLAGIQFAEFNYKTKPKTDFQKEALAFNEDVNYGFEKYTYGIDLLPLWTTILPSDKSGIHNFFTRLLSARFRSVKELTQTSGQVTEPSVAYPSSRQLDSGTSYSFRTKYRFQSASIPLFLFMGNRGHLNIGVARWNFSRTYAMTVPPEDGNQYIFDASVQTDGIVGEFYYELHESSLDTPIGRSGLTPPAILEGLRFDMFIGISLTKDTNQFQIEGGDVKELLDDEDLEIENHNFEITVSYPFELLSSMNMLDVALRVGAEVNSFQTDFSAFGSKSDWILNPWARLSVEFN